MQGAGIDTDNCISDTIHDTLKKVSIERIDQFFKNCIGDSVRVFKKKTILRGTKYKKNLIKSYHYKLEYFLKIIEK